MGRQRKYEPLTEADKMLILQCKEERERLETQIKELRSADVVHNFAAIQRLKAERKELNDAKLAEKFETTKYKIWMI